MWAISDRFRDAVSRPHTVITGVNYTLPGGTPQTLQFSSGTVTTDRTQRIRRTATLQVIGGSLLFDQLSTPGCRIAVDHGFLFGGNDQELVPMIRGELSSAALQLGDGLIQISVADNWQGLAGADYLTPYTPAVTARRLATIITAVTDVYPTVTIRNTATDTGTIATAQAWTSRADMITALAADGNTAVYFAPDGALVLRDNPKISDPVSWLIKTGDGGTLKDLSRSRPLDKIFNAVILTPATADPAQGWTQVTAVISDTNNPRHPAKLGRTVPYRWSSPTAITGAQAAVVAGQVLDRLQGSTETLSLGAISNPALEGGDIVRVLTPIDGGNTIVNHFLDSAQTDLATGAMSCGTRANDEFTS